MAARLTRAKKKIAAAEHPVRRPGRGAARARLDAVLTVVHLLATTGHTAPSGSELVRADLAERALDLARHAARAAARRARGRRACSRSCSSCSAARRPHRRRGRLVRSPDQDRVAAGTRR